MKKNKCLVKISIWIVLLILVLPFLINVLILSPQFFPIIATGQEWLLFWGSYLGGVATLFAVYYSVRSNQQEKKKEAKIKWKQECFKAKREAVLEALKAIQPNCLLLKPMEISYLTLKGEDTIATALQNYSLFTMNMRILLKAKETMHLSEEKEREQFFLTDFEKVAQSFKEISNYDKEIVAWALDVQRLQDEVKTKTAILGNLNRMLKLYDAGITKENGDENLKKKTELQNEVGQLIKIIDDKNKKIQDPTKIKRLYEERTAKVSLYEVDFESLQEKAAEFLNFLQEKALVPA